jgi:hypothetical protein
MSMNGRLSHTSGCHAGIWIDTLPGVMGWNQESCGRYGSI